MTTRERIDKIKLKICPDCGDRLRDERQIQCNRCKEKRK